MRIFELDKTKKFFRGKELGNFTINSTPAKIGHHKEITIYPAVCISYRTKNGVRYDIPLKPEYFGVNGFMYSSMITMAQETSWETIWVINPTHYKNEIMFTKYLKESELKWEANIKKIWESDFQKICSFDEFVKNPIKFILTEKFNKEN